MNGVLVTAHGKFSEGLVDGLSLITGAQENVIPVNFLESDGIEGIDKKLHQALDKLKSYKNIIILTDLAGGTPFNRAVMITSELENSRVLAGVNFQMLYTAVFDGTEEIDLLVENILSEGKNGIRVYEMIENESNENEEDGI